MYIFGGEKTVTVYVTFHVLLRELVQSLIRLKSKFTSIYQYMFNVYYYWIVQSLLFIHDILAQRNR